MSRTGISGLCLATLLLILTACSQDPAPPDPSNPTVYDVPDPAMEQPVAATAPVTETIVIEPAPEPATAEDQAEAEAEVERSIVDVAGQRVFFPDRGWLGIDTFRDIYENRPQEMPDDIDLQAVHELMSSLATDDSTP